jgi:hypothetical protein
MSGLLNMAAPKPRALYFQLHKSRANNLCLLDNWCNMLGLRNMRLPDFQPS